MRSRRPALCARGRACGCRWRSRRSYECGRLPRSMGPMGHMGPMKRLATLALGAAWFGGCAAKPEPAGPPPLRPGTMAYDQHVFTTLLEEHTKITRTVREIEGGIESVTESDDPKIA